MEQTFGACYSPEDDKNRPVILLLFLSADK
jgi:hypothetical protein